MLVSSDNTNPISTGATVQFFEGGLPDTFHSGGVNGSLTARKLTQVFSMNCFDEEVGTLSIREREVLEFLSRGFLIKEIPDQMGISFDTVRTYIRRIYQKLHVHSRTQAVAKYLRPGNVINP